MSNIPIRIRCEKKPNEVRTIAYLLLLKHEKEEVLQVAAFLCSTQSQTSKRSPVRAMLNQAAKTFGFASSVRPAFVFRHLSAAHCQRPSKNSPQSPAGTPLISATNATNHSSLHRPVAAASPVFGIARCPHRLTARGGRGGAPAGRKGPICSHSLKNAGPLIRGPSFPEHSPLRRYYRSYTNPNPSLTRTPQPHFP